MCNEKIKRSYVNDCGSNRQFSKSIRDALQDPTLEFNFFRRSHGFVLCSSILFPIAIGPIAAKVAVPSVRKVLSGTSCANSHFQIAEFSRMATVGSSLLCGPWTPVDASSHAFDPQKNTSIRPAICGRLLTKALVASLGRCGGSETSRCLAVDRQVVFENLFIFDLFKSGNLFPSLLAQILAETGCP